MGITGMGGFIFAWDLGVIFLGIPKWVAGGFLEKIVGLKGVIEKCVGCFLVYFFRGAGVLIKLGNN